MASRAQFDEFYTTYQSLMRQLLKQLELTVEDFKLFHIEDIKAIDEENVREHGVDFLEVTSMHDDVHRSAAISALSKTSKAIGESTLYVSRSPGLLLVNDQQDDIRQLLDDINAIKDTLANAVRYIDMPTGDTKIDANLPKRDKHQRHKFLHDALPGVMSEQLYRHIYYIDEPVSHVWFNWVQRPVNRKMDHASARQYLNEQRVRPRDEFTPTQWDLRMDEAVVALDAFDFFETKRLLRNMPIMTYQYTDDTRRNTKNANMPVILFGQGTHGLPKTSELKHWNKNARQAVSRNVLGLHKELLVPSLNFYGVRDTRNSPVET